MDYQQRERARNAGGYQQMPAAHVEEQADEHSWRQAVQQQLSMLVQLMAD